MVTGGVEHHPDEFDEPAEGAGGAVDSVNGETGAVTLSAADVSAVPSSYLDTDGTLAANSDTKVASQKAAKTYVDTAVATKAPATRTVGTSLGTSGTVDLDMSSVHGTIQTITATGTITFTTSNRAAGREVTLVIAAGGSSRTLAWPSWTAIGAALPTALASGKTIVVTVTFTSTTEASGIAAAAVQP